MNEATKEKYHKDQPYAGCIGRFPRAILMVSRVSVDGAVKHGVPTIDQGFAYIPNAANILLEAKCRHILSEARGEEVDPEWDYLHAAHEAWNALARLETILIEKEKKDGARNEGRDADKVMGAVGANSLPRGCRS